MTSGARWALTGLAAILVITAGWWALALWPLPGDAPEWLIRTRAACFGVTPSGLPNAGGWALLVGQPVGMLLFLIAVWGGGLREGIAALRRRNTGRLALGGTALLLGFGALAVTARVAEAGGERFDPTGRGGTDRPGPLVELGKPAPALDLVDQHGTRVSIEGLQGTPAIVTFAFAHCETVCPLLVKQALDAAAASPRLAPQVIVVTLDPWRDTPSRLPAIAEAWGLPDGAHVLSGSVEEVESVLNRWQIPRIRNETSGDLIHPAVSYVVWQGHQLYQTDGSTEALRLGLSRID